MNRVTQYHYDGLGWTVNEHGREYGGDAIDRLAAYEDTGLEPDEVKRLLEPEPNPPLTLEELREMDGEPVWNDTMKKWALVDLLNDVEPRTVDAQGRWRDLEDRYYRRKPEGPTP